MLQRWRNYHLAAAAMAALVFVAAATGADFNMPFAPSLSLTRGISNTAVVYRGQTNFQYILYASSNATTWSGIMTNLCTGPAMSFTDSNRPIRFYRAGSLKTSLLFQCSFSGSENGEFMILVRTNDTAALVGFDSNVEGAFANSLVIDTNNQCCGTIFANRTGCLAFTSNSVSGSLSNGPTRVATVSGTLKSNSGTFQSVAGIYSGTLTFGCDATVKAILAPDGTLYLYCAYTTGTTDGGTVVLTTSTFTLPTFRGAHFTGALSVAQQLMQGGIAHACDDAATDASFLIRRSEKLF